MSSNSAIFAVEGDTKKTNFSKVAIGTVSPGPYKLDVRGNANVGATTATTMAATTITVGGETVASEALALAYAIALG